MAVVAGNQGFLAIGDWLASYQTDLPIDFPSREKQTPILQHHQTGVADDRIPGVLQTSGTVFRASVPNPEKRLL